MLAGLALAACQWEAPSAPINPQAQVVQSTSTVAPAIKLPEMTHPSAQIAQELVATLARSAEAALSQTAACLAHSEKDGAARSIAVHRWIDRAGITHYSDQPPATNVREHRVLEVQGLPPISVQASGKDVNLPDQLQQRAVADALGVQRVMRDVLGVGAPVGLALHVVFVRSAETYAQVIGEPALASSAGAYSTAQRTIYVRWQAQDETSFAVLRHEITHALVHESIGNLPTPINEGLAEYFERYRVAGLGGQVDVNIDRSTVMAAAPRNDDAAALVDLLARDSHSFYVDDAGVSGREKRYAQAYALVALLMGEAPGRAALAAVLAEERADPCVPVAAERTLDRRYPGGLRGLSKAWADFMRDPPTGIQAY